MFLLNKLIIFIWLEYGKSTVHVVFADWCFIQLPTNIGLCCCHTLAESLLCSTTDVQFKSLILNQPILPGFIQPLSHYLLDTFQDFFIAQHIQTYVQLWPLIKNDPKSSSYLLPKFSREPPQLEKSDFLKLIIFGAKIEISGTK